VWRIIEENILPHIIGIMVHRKEILTKKESVAQGTFLAKLDVRKRTTKKPIIVAIIGLVGSGVSSVAQKLAKRIGATIIAGDDIRIELRKQEERYERARAIAENVAIEVVKRGGNVILDSDFIDAKKRASIREKARKAGIQIIFICVYCDPDIVLGRILMSSFYDRVNDFFGGATSKWEGRSKGAVVKIREMWRRTPWHYRWNKKGGGQWIIKKPPCTVLADIDTTTSLWKHKVEECARKILAM